MGVSRLFACNSDEETWLSDCIGRGRGPCAEMEQKYQWKERVSSEAAQR